MGWGGDGDGVGFWEGVVVGWMVGSGGVGWVWVGGVGWGALGKGWVESTPHQLYSSSALHHLYSSSPLHLLFISSTLHLLFISSHLVEHLGLSNLCPRLLPAEGEGDSCQGVLVLRSLIDLSIGKHIHKVAGLTVAHPYCSSLRPDWFTTQHTNRIAFYDLVCHRLPPLPRPFSCCASISSRSNSARCSALWCADTRSCFSYRCATRAALSSSFVFASAPARRRAYVAASLSYPVFLMLFALAPFHSLSSSACRSKRSRADRLCSSEYSRSVYASCESVCVSCRSVSSPPARPRFSFTVAQ